MTLADGTPLRRRSVSGHSPRRHSLQPASARRWTPEPGRKPPAARLRRDGGSRGGVFTGEVGRGDSVAVFGCGGVGCAAIAGARLAGASTVIAVDLDARKLEVALSSGRPTP